MTVYFTLDASGEHIEERAHIAGAETMEEALASARDSYAGSDFDVVALTAGRFGDCWIEVHDRQTLDAKLDEWTAEAGELHVRQPGTHPGGNVFWIEPAEVIFVPVLIEKEITQ